MNSSIECSSWAKSFDPKPVTAVFWSYIFSCILTVLMLTPAVFLNFLVIFVITRTRSLCKPSNMLLCSLALADFGTGILAQPLYTTHIVTEIEGDVTLFCVTGAITAFVSYTLAGAGLFTLTAISVDRCLAIYRPMKYRACVTPKAVVQASVCMWIVAAFGASTRLLLNVKYFMFSLGVTMFVSLTTILVCSVLAFRSLKTQKEQIAGEMRLHQGKQMRLERSLEAISKTLRQCCGSYSMFIPLSIPELRFGALRG
ncbi:beta-3 adrenergic receptor isoform X1 [Nematostella vectensis]|uniref:beta-3 adrenergic receptor isoform X1 n=1 Tax=Nematostella vectensis TaxID=45351 RepID=UPI00138FE6AB|nr:beta-3 adrenergic receptor isoform X1 [Nematostella vectensis]